MHFPKARYMQLPVSTAHYPLFSDFVQTTFPCELDPWQVWLCNRLERLRYERGQRIILSVCPQIGKSVVVAQRLIPYLIGCNPQSRNGIASLNAMKSIDQVMVMQSLMRGQEYLRLFPSSDVRITSDARQEQFSVQARASMHDGEPSVVSLNMNTDFVGRGWDGTLVLDDPYSSAVEANDPGFNEQLRDFLSRRVEPRLTSDANVIVCFHRYHAKDLAGYLIERDPAEWEYIRLAAIADDEPEYPDPLGRLPGELLSTRLDTEMLQKLKDEDLPLFRARFQGLPCEKL